MHGTKQVSYDPFVVLVSLARFMFCLYQFTKVDQSILTEALYIKKRIQMRIHAHLVSVWQAMNVTRVIILV
jgi:hypothetical protein